MLLSSVCLLKFPSETLREERDRGDRGALCDYHYCDVQRSVSDPLNMSLCEPSEEIRYWIEESAQIVVVTCSGRLKLTFFFGMDFLFLDKLDFFFVSMAARLSMIIIIIRNPFNSQ